MESQVSQRKKLEPLNVTCTTTACDEGLHCFKQKRKIQGRTIGGKCRDCGAELIDWAQVRKRDISSAANTFAILKNELIRHVFWHADIDSHALNHARRKGRVALKATAKNRLRKSVGDSHHAMEGRQTGKSGNIIFYAQHATACCCRACIDYWHGIPPGRKLTEEEIDYFTDLAMLFINERLPDLKEEGEKVPSIKRTKNSSMEAIDNDEGDRDETD